MNAPAVILAATISLFCYPDGARLPVTSLVLPVANETWNPSTRTVTLDACRGETVAFQCALMAPASVPAVAIAATHLYGPGMARIHRDSVRTFLELPIYVDARRKDLPGKLPGPAWFYDALRPADWPRVFPVPAGHQVVWFDVAIPADAVPGDYEGWIYVAEPSGHQSFTLRIHVRPGILARSSIPFVVGFQEPPFNKAHGLARWDSDGGAALGAYLAMARAHGITLALRGFMPAVKWEADGRVKAVDWGAYDRAFAALISDSTGEPWLVPHPPHFRAAFDNQPGDSLAVSSWFAEVARHWRAKGWPWDRAYMWVHDEPRGRKITPQVVARYRAAVNRAAPGLHVLVTESVEDSAYVAGGDWIACRADRYYPPEMDGLKRAGRIGQAWSYQWSEPALTLETIDARPPGFRAWPWFARRYVVDAAFYWAGNFWAPDAFTVPDGQPAVYNDGNGTLFYPGPFSSIRMKQVRRGQQDMAILDLALSAVADSLVHAMVRSALCETYIPRPVAGGSHYLGSRVDPRWTLDHVSEWEQLPSGWDRAVNSLRK